MNNVKKIIVAYIRLSERAWELYVKEGCAVLLIDPISCNSRHQPDTFGEELTLDNIYRASSWELDIPEGLLKEILKQLEA